MQVAANQPPIGKGPRHANEAEKPIALLLVTVASGLLVALLGAGAVSIGLLAGFAAWAKAVILVFGIAASVLLVASGWVGLQGYYYRVIVPGPGNKFDLQAKALLGAIICALLAVAIAVAAAPAADRQGQTAAPEDAISQRLDDLERRIDRRFAEFDRSRDDMRSLTQAIEELRMEVQGIAERSPNSGNATPDGATSGDKGDKAR